MRRIAWSVAVFACTGFLAAQVNKSNLTGIVRDATGAAVPEVTIKLTNVETGAVRMEASDAIARHSIVIREITTDENLAAFLDCNRKDPPRRSTAGLKAAVEVPCRIQAGDVVKHRTVKCRKTTAEKNLALSRRDDDGDLVGCADPNPKALVHSSRLSVKRGYGQRTRSAQQDQKNEAISDMHRRQN